MKIALKLNKSVQENAAIYFEKAKKAKKKLDGALEAIERSKKKLEKEKKKFDKEQSIHEEKQKDAAKKRIKKYWFEKFRWFTSSEGFLVIGGRDATTNEIVIKKNTLSDDVVFHTDMSGSPFFVVKSDVTMKEIGKEKKASNKVTEITLNEAANATVVFSKAWKLGMSASEVFHVTPEQVTKTANAGEYLQKGSFMIRGKTNYLSAGTMEVAIGVLHLDNGDVVISGPESAISNQTKDFIVLQQGKDKVSDIAKIVRNKFGGELDEIIRMLPAGAFKIKKKR
jgi:predicted ribosome quality control (RQC) complex YloA/Tae2 family protein